MSMHYEHKNVVETPGLSLSLRGITRDQGSVWSTNLS